MNYKKLIVSKLLDFDKLSSKDPWSNVITAVIEKHRGTDKAEFIKLKYKNKKTNIYIAQKLYISQRLTYDWEKEIINEIAILAAYEHLLKP